ncbi:MAG: hypothetical protein ABIJ96_15935 [Elusimicrobiota bacterium]
MSSAYPPTGRYDDLLMILARAEERRIAGKIPVKRRLSRVWLEPWWNALGAAIAVAVHALPAAAAARLHDRLFLAALGGQRPHPFDDRSEHLGRAERLIAQAHRAAGRAPALLCLTSHPPAFGELMYLNVELVRHALWGLRRLRAEPCRPRLVIAMDYYALDMLALYEEGLYAGFTGRCHLGFDRLAHLRPAPGRALLRGTAWTNVVRRILAALAAGGEVGMVLGGGVPGTSRVFYCAREFVGRLYRERPTTEPSGRIRERLCAAAADFKRFIGSGEIGAPAMRNIRRAMEGWVLSCLVRDGGLDEVDAGRVPPVALEALAACAGALGWRGEEAARRRADFIASFARETPSRERFFSVLARRVAASGTPVLILPLTYGRPDAIAMRFGEPVCILGARREAAGWSVELAGKEPRRLPLRSFCRDFVARHYP